MNYKFGDKIQYIGELVRYEDGFATEYGMIGVVLQQEDGMVRVVWEKDIVNTDVVYLNEIALLADIQEINKITGSIH